MRRLPPLIVCTMLLSAAALAGAVRRDPTPLALPANSGGFALDVNSRGQVLGVVFGNPDIGSFLMSRGTVDAIDFPGAGFSSARGLNNRGDIVGAYRDDQQFHGFLRSHDGKFFTVDVPGADGTMATDVNATRNIVGRYVEVLPNTDERFHGFLLTAAGFQVIDNPFGGFHTFPESITDAGVIVGTFGGDQDSPRHGFVVDDGAWTILDYPGADSTFLNGISNDGTIVGYAFFPDDVPAERGFVYRNGRFIDLPAVYLPYGVNASGITVGVWYRDGSGPLPACLALQGRTCGP